VVVANKSDKVDRLAVLRIFVEKNMPTGVPAFPERGVKHALPIPVEIWWRLFTVQIWQIVHNIIPKFDHIISCQIVGAEIVFEIKDVCQFLQI
jgi:hypothetical protein